MLIRLNAENLGAVGFELYSGGELFMQFRHFGKGILVLLMGRHLALEPYHHMNTVTAQALKFVTKNAVVQ